jgi:hypothetical protein
LQWLSLLKGLQLLSWGCTVVITSPLRMVPPLKRQRFSRWRLSSNQGIDALISAIVFWD